MVYYLLACTKSCMCRGKSIHKLSAAPLLTQPLEWTMSGKKTVSAILATLVSCTDISGGRSRGIDYSYTTDICKGALCVPLKKCWQAPASPPTFVSNHSNNFKYLVHDLQTTYIIPNSSFYRFPLVLPLMAIYPYKLRFKK